VTAAVESPRIARPRERRDVALLAAGLMVSVAGDAAALVALLLELRAAGVGWVAALLAADLVPFILLAPLSGRLVDRVDNRRLLVASLAAQAVLVVPLAFVRTPLVIVLLVVLVAAVSTVVRPAVSAMVPALTGDDRAPAGYAWVATGTGVGWIAGPAAGGLLTGAFGVTAALLADAAIDRALAASAARIVVDDVTAGLLAGRVAIRRIAGRHAVIDAGAACGDDGAT
jgi:MFS family permease